MAKIISVSEAVDLIHNGMTVGIKIGRAHV